MHGNQSAPAGPVRCAVTPQPGRSGRAASWAGLRRHAAVGLGHDEPSPADAAKRAFGVDAASVHTRLVHAVLALVPVCQHRLRVSHLCEDTDADAGGRAGSHLRTPCWSCPARIRGNIHRCSPRTRGCSGRSRSRAGSHSPRRCSCGRRTGSVLRVRGQRSEGARLSWDLLKHAASLS